MTELSDQSDEWLLTRWRTGEQACGQILVKRYHASIDRFFMHKLGSGSDSGDLVQETFFGIFRGLQQFRGEASFRTLLFAIARNKLIDHLRNSTRDARRFDPEHHSVTDFARSSLSMLEIHERNKLLVAGLRSLPLNAQIMLELHYWERMRIKDIALVLELPVGTVKTHMRSSRQRLETEIRALAVSPERLKTTQRGLEGWAEQLRRELDEDEVGQREPEQ